MQRFSGGNVSEYLWHCPFCSKDETVTDKGSQATFSDRTIDNADILLMVLSLMAKKHIALRDTHSAEVDLFGQTNLFVLPT